MASASRLAFAAIVAGSGIGIIFAVLGIWLTTLPESLVYIGLATGAPGGGSPAARSQSKSSRTWGGPSRSGHGPQSVVISGDRSMLVAGLRCLGDGCDEVEFSILNKLGNTREERSRPRVATVATSMVISCERSRRL